MNIPRMYTIALGSSGYTEDEARFLYLVATHSGLYLPAVCPLHQWQARKAEPDLRSGSSNSRRVIPMSTSLKDALAAHKLGCERTALEDLVFCTTKGTPLSPKNLYNRVLAPTCDRIGLPRISWHSFRHINPTLLGEVGESVKTAQAILGHSDLETTLNTYMHAIPDSQRRAVERVAGVLFPDVPNFSPDSKESGRVN